MKQQHDAAQLNERGETFEQEMNRLAQEAHERQVHRDELIRLQARADFVAGRRACAGSP